MPRPKTKNELLELSEKNFNKLLDMANEVDSKDADFTFPEGYLNRNVKDVLGHLHEWHLMMLNWYKVGMSGDKPDMPSKGYTWKTTSELNKEIQKKYSGEAYSSILNLLKATHKQVMDVIQKHSDDELFTKKLYKWTGSTSLGAYLISSTSSHYDWGIKLIKKCTK